MGMDERLRSKTIRAPRRSEGGGRGSAKSKTNKPKQCLRKMPDRGRRAVDKSAGGTGRYASRMTFRNAAPNSCSFLAPTPFTSANSFSLCGRRWAMSSSDLSEKIT